MKIVAAFLLALVVSGVVGHLDGYHEKATTLLDESEPTTLVTPAKVRVKNVKDARKLQRVLDQITTYTSREDFEKDVSPLRWCVDFNYVYNPDYIPMSTTPVNVMSTAGDPVFSAQSSVDETNNDEIPNFVGSINSYNLEFVTNKYIPGEDPFGNGDVFFTMDLFEDVTAWGGDFKLYTNDEGLDMELEIESGTITLPVEAIDEYGTSSFFGFRIIDDVVSSIKLKSRNALPGSELYYGSLVDMCATVPGWTVSCEDTTSCDFSTLTPNAYDEQVLLDTCGFGAFSFDGAGVNVFDSSNIRSKYDDPDLGSPNIKCSPKGPGRGTGGIPSAPFPNCNPLGNLLIIQSPRVTDHPNDRRKGGCIYFDFGRLSPTYLVSIKDFGLLDIEEGVTINFTTFDLLGEYFDFTIDPDMVGNNGHWIASNTTAGLELLSGLTGVVYMEVCLKGSGAVSFVDYTKCTGGYTGN